MNPHIEKLELFKLILETENPSILNAIKKILLTEKKKDFFDSLSEDQKKEIHIGIQEIENNETVNYDEFMSKFRK